MQFTSDHPDANVSTLHGWLIWASTDRLRWREVILDLSNSRFGDSGLTTIEPPRLPQSPSTWRLNPLCPPSQTNTSPSTTHSILPFAIDRRLIISCLMSNFACLFFNFFSFSFSIYFHSINTCQVSDWCRQDLQRFSADRSLKRRFLVSSLLAVYQLSWFFPCFPFPSTGVLFKLAFIVLLVLSFLISIIRQVGIIIVLCFAGSERVGCTKSPIPQAVGTSTFFH